jgi:HSP20 family molecular chaperone IbpA
MPVHMEKAHIYKTIKFPVEIKPDNVKAMLKNGILEVALPKAESSRRSKSK